MQAKVKIAIASKLVCLKGDAETFVSESTCYPYILLLAIDFVIAYFEPCLQKLVTYVPKFWQAVIVMFLHIRLIALTLHKSRLVLRVSIFFHHRHQTIASFTFLALFIHYLFLPYCPNSESVTK